MRITATASDIRGFVYNQTALMARAGKPGVECTADNEDALTNLMDAVVTQTAVQLRAALWPTYEYTLTELAEEDVMLDVPEMAISSEGESRAQMQLTYALGYGLTAEWLRSIDAELTVQYGVLYSGMVGELSATLLSKTTPAAETVTARGDVERTDGDAESGMNAKEAREDTEHTGGDAESGMNAKEARGDVERTDGDAESGMNAKEAREDTERADGGGGDIQMQPALQDDMIVNPRRINPRWLKEHGEMIELKRTWM